MSFPLRPLLTILAVCLAAAAPAAAQNIDPMPAIVVSPTSFDFGTMEQEQIRTTEMTITNAGGAPLEIQHIEATCGCTAAQPDKKLLQPGESTALSITFDSKQFVGDQTKSVFIHTNDPAEPAAEITLIAHIHAPLLYTPTWRSVGLGRGRPSEIEPKSFEVRSPDVEVLEVELDQADPNLFRIEILPSEKNGPEAKRIVIHIAEGAPAGEFRELMVFRTNVPGAPTFDYEVLGEVQADVFLHPTRHNFRYVGAGQTLVHSFYLKKGKDAVLPLKEVTVDLPGFEVTEIKENPVTGHFRIRVQGKALASNDPVAVAAKGRMRGTLKVVAGEQGDKVFEAEILYMLKL